MSPTSAPANEESIARRHARWILRGALVAPVVVGGAAILTVRALGLPLVAELAIVALVVMVTLALAPTVISSVLARIFLEKFIKAELEVRPSNNSECADLVIPWLASQGFTDHGSWMLVGAECGTIFGGVGARVAHHPDHAILAIVHDTQINVASDLSNGQTLVTSSLGVIPHPALTIQGIKGGDLPALLGLHNEALRALAATGVSAAAPTGGPVQARLRFELRDQEYFRSITRAEAQSLMFSVVEQPLAPLTL